MRGLSFFLLLSLRQATRNDIKILAAIRLKESLQCAYVAENLRNQEYVKLKIPPRVSNI